ncbi:UNVERIFIED_CONTAM: hypothetical protein Sradi_7017800 [Sesamum radiatum]|uniref:Uncharacterized protein n=1 Tax=Sesamum radiatum TaxID=300843 RepID=A0AAW2JAL6_SESRA
MDSSQTLCSLTHTQTPNSPHTNSSQAGDGDLAPDDEGRADTDNQIKASFNMDEFMCLANKIVDVADRESMAILEALQLKWKAKFGSQFAEPLRLKPVSEREVTPFRPPLMRVARRIPRLPTPEQQNQI